MDLTKYKNKSRILLIKSTNYKLKEFLRNLSIWAIITLVIIVIIYFISL